jgi:hypothetical protein
LVRQRRLFTGMGYRHRALGVNAPRTWKLTATIKF